MCGIFGVVGRIESAQAEACLARLAHRGPDGSSLWSGEGVTLGHTRLAILDRAARADQPMASRDGRYRIVFNGEIYNFLELRQELIGHGHRFVTDSDTEVILCAFAQWGPSCLDRFNGMWSFAIWDTRERALFLARDRFGKKPLFYAQIPEVGFIFASEMKAIVPLLPNVRANASLIRDRGRMFLYESSAECLVENIARFPAANWGWLREDKLTTRRWWCTLDHLVGVPDSYADQTELLRETFLHACRLRLRSDVPVGTSLSGGLDSSAVISGVAQVARNAHLERTPGGWQTAFVASFPGTALDETVYARRAANHLGIDPVVIEVDPVAAASNLLRDCYLFEELYVTNPAPFMQVYREVRRRGVSVSLDGHAADELFGGYPMDFPAALWDARRDPALRWQVLLTCIDALPEARAQFPRPGNPVQHWLGWQAKDLVKRFLGYNARLSSRDRRHPAWHQLDTLGRRLYISTHETILPTLLRNYDRYSMANGVEVRMPFLDHRVVCLAFSLPWHAKIRNGYSKAILRDAMAPYMPAEIAYRKTKIGFNAPIMDWMRGPLREFFLDAVESRAFRESELIHPARAAAQVRKLIRTASPTFAQGERAWTLLAPYFWEQGFLKGLGEPHVSTGRIAASVSA
jgi:asparagine synthase (glutamine-hydrolysing)